MKIVIDIPEERYKDIQRIAEVQLNRRTPTVEQIVANGTQLQKNHGDLISRQAVLDNIKTRLWQTALNNDEYITSYAKVCEDIAENRIDTWVNEVPSAESEE